MSAPTARLKVPTAVVLCALLVGGCSSSGPPAAQPARSPSAPPTATTASPTSPPPTTAGGEKAAPRVTMVLAVSVDGLAPAALEELGPELAPTFWGLAEQGASTFDARTELELTVTLPNHAGMMTGRRVAAEAGGHGWTVNYDTGGRVTGAGHRPVTSVFDVVARAGGSTALFASKGKFRVFDRSWPAIDEYVYALDNAVLTERAAEDLRKERRALTFVHLSHPDDVGHARGWGSPHYLRAVADVDVWLEHLLATVDSDRYLRRHLVVVVTADHGGHGLAHGAVDNKADYTVPFLVRGPGVPAGADLYALNPGRADPGDSRPSYDAPRQPVRNGDLANLVTSLLGLDPVPGSEFGVDDPLVVRTEAP